MARSALFSFLVLSNAAFGEPIFPEPVREVVTRVCGYCHYPDFFDDATGELIEQRFLDKSELILDRLQRPVGAVGRMPPKRSPLTVTDDERTLLIKFLQSQTPGPATPAEDNVPSTP